jgi:hypothetical protein
MYSMASSWGWSDFDVPFIRSCRFEQFNPRRPPVDASGSGSVNLKLRSQGSFLASQETLGRNLIEGSVNRRVDGSKNL